MLIRHNVLALVHYGFSRMDCYNMPVGEFEDYIKLINKQIEDEKNKDSGDNSSNVPNTINTLSNTNP